MSAGIIFLILMMVIFIIAIGDWTVFVFLLLIFGLYTFSVMDENAEKKKMIETKTEQLQEQIEVIKAISKKENVKVITIEEQFKDFPLTKLELEELTFPEPSYISLATRKSQYASIYRKKHNVFACIADDLNNCFNAFKTQVHSDNTKYLCNIDSCYRAR